MTKEEELQALREENRILKALVEEETRSNDAGTSALSVKNTG
jgi:hypothetical protein